MPDLLELTVGIAASYVSGNRVTVDELAAVIKDIYRTLAAVDAPPTEAIVAHRTPTPSQIRRSIQPDALISFEDGKPYVILRRHLNTLGMTFEDYVAKWGLPAHYPVAAPSYSAARAETARRTGLGRKIASPSSTEGGAKRTIRAPRSSEDQRKRHLDQVVSTPGRAMEAF